MKLSTRLTVAMVALVLLTATVVGLLINRNVLQRALPRALDRIDTHAHLLASELDASVRGARADVSTQGRAVDGFVLTHLAGGLHPLDGTLEQEWRERLTSRFVAELTAKPTYLQFRLIGVADRGREILRVDRLGPGGAIRVMPDGELQRKGDQSFFKETVGLPAGQIYVAPVGFSQNDHNLEIRNVPTLRVAAPVPAPDGSAFGILVINVDMRPAFAAIRSAAREDGHIYVVNEQGDYLVHPDPSKEFGFERGQPVRIQDDFPELVNLLGLGETAPLVLQDRTGTRFGFGWESVQLAGGPRISVIESLPYSSILAIRTVVPSMLGGLVALLIALPLAVLLARSLSKPLVQMTKRVEAFARDQSIVIPTGGSGEIGILASAFARMADDVREKTAVLKRANDERSLADEKFRLAVDASPSGLIMIDATGGIMLINAEIERMFGYQRDELINQPVDILVPRDARIRHAQHRAGFVNLPEARRMGAGRELFGVRKEGTEFPIEIGLNPIRTQDGLLVLSVIVDISERKRAEASLREYAEREQLFIAAVESSNDAIVTKNLDGIITGWNRAAEHLFGFSAQEAIGESIDIIVPEELRGEVRIILGKIRGGEKVEHHETVRISKDRRRIDVSLSISPVKSSKGTIIGAAKVARDITERKKAQQALYDSEQMARGIIDTALDAFLQLNESGEITDWSPKAAAMFGWSHQEAVGKKVRDLIVPPENRPAHAERMTEFLRDADGGAVGRRYESPSLRRDGKMIDTEISLTALRRRGGYVINGFIRDVTEKKVAEERIRQSEKLESIGQLTGGIAHDFNNMLTVITGTIEILSDAVADKPQLAAIAKLISEAADRGAELTGQLLAFARKQPLQPRETDVNALMVESTKLLRPTLGEHVEIELKVDKDAYPALVDRSQLISALLNLAVNARDAMPSGGKLTLETKNVVLDRSYAEVNGEVQPGNYVMIAVSDTGAGIPAELLDKIFEPFFSTKDVGKGTGLGLSMVYGFVKQSGGHIKVYSEQGQGTTIRVYLPQAGAQAAPFAEAAPEATIESGNETILVVEDDAMVRASVVSQLRSLGYQTLPAANADEALAIVDSGATFDLLFTDVVMPGLMNGRRLADEVIKRRPGMRALFTSGYTENAIIHHGRLDPGVLLLAKPYRKAELARMIRIALDTAPKLQSDSGLRRQAMN